MSRLFSAFACTFLAGCSLSSPHSGAALSSAGDADVRKAQALLTDLTLAQDAYSDLLSGFDEGPFPKEPNLYSSAERLTAPKTQIAGLAVSPQTAERLYVQIVEQENYFATHPRNPVFIRNNLNENVIITGGGSLSLQFQAVIYELFSVTRANRNEDPTHPSRQIVKSDEQGRKRMLAFLKSLSAKHGYTLTAYLWSDDPDQFNASRVPDKRTDALRFYLLHR